MRLRCWARHGDPGHLCDKTPKHSDRHRGCDARVERFWNDSECAHNANSAGRETAALRILEVSHELDRLAFFAGDTDSTTEYLRAVAARLYANTIAAPEDLRTLTEEVDACRALVAICPPYDATTEASEVLRLMLLASDLLRPFAGVT